MQDMLVVKDEETERAVPTEWRQSLKTIADAVVSSRLPIGEGIRTIDPETLSISNENIEDYPDTLGPLADDCWKTSIYVWTGKHWDVLVDLSSEDGQTTDLVMQVRVYAAGQSHEYQLHLIYVP